MSADEYECRDRWKVVRPEHDFAANDAEGTELDACYWCGVEAS